MTRDDRANAAIERRNDWVQDAHKNEPFAQTYRSTVAFAVPMTPYHHEFRSEHVKDGEGINTRVAHPNTIHVRNYETSKERGLRV